GSEPVVHGRFGRRAQRQSAGGDSQLGAGEQDRDLGAAAKGGAGRSALGGGVLQPVSPGGDKRELDRNEERADRDQARRNGEDDPWIPHRPPPQFESRRTPRQARAGPQI